MELHQALEKIREVGTNGINCDVTTDDIVARLIDWSRRFSFEVLSVDFDTVELKLNSLPTNLSDFCKEVYEFCPDVIDQGYDCLVDVLALAEETGEAIASVDPALLAGLDPDAEDFGLQVMERDLPQVMSLTLWWD